MIDEAKNRVAIAKLDVLCAARDLTKVGATDAGVIVDAQDFARLRRACKAWEAANRALSDVAGGTL